RAADVTLVTYCQNRVGNVCGAPCTTYNGGSACINAPGTNCLSATSNVAFCTGPNCSGTCSQISQCLIPLARGFCYVPNTKSILIGP
ncbi:hypothetical protein DFH08DRAFT_687034, partial [Mycena albidolilacea]